MKLTRRILLHSFKYRELPLITIKQCKLMQYVLNQSNFLWFLKYSVCRQMFCLNVLASFFNIALHVSDLETIIFAYFFGSSGQCFDC